MTTTKTTSVQVKTTDSKGSGHLEYNVATNVQVGNLELTWNGGKLAFSSYADYVEFFNQVAIPCMDIMNSTSGTGVGFVAVVTGTPGTDKVVNS